MLNEFNCKCYCQLVLSCILSSSLFTSVICDTKVNFNIDLNQMYLQLDDCNTTGDEFYKVIEDLENNFKKNYENIIYFDQSEPESPNGPRAWKQLNPYLRYTFI